MTADNDSKDTRAIILARARELFVSQGYHNTTMRTIAKAAGISTGPLYFHFRNKGEVFFHICSAAYDYLIADYRRIAGNASHAGLRLRDIFYAYKAFYYQEPQLFEIMHLATTPLAGIDLPQQLRETLNQKSQVQLLIMTDVIREGISRRELRPVDPCRLALYLHSVAEGVFLSNRSGVFDQFEVSLDEMIEAAINLIGFGMIDQKGEPVDCAARPSPSGLEPRNP